MRRFAYRASKLILPSAFALYTLKPVFSLQPDEKKSDNLLIQQIDLKSITPAQQANPLPTANSEGQFSRSGQRQENANKNQNNEQQKTNQKPQRQQIEQLTISNMQKQTQNVAEVSCQIPQQVKKYLSIQGLKVVSNDSLQQNNIRIRNREGVVMQFKYENNVQSHTIFQINKFLKPIQLVSTQQELSRIIRGLAEDEYIIASYIPTVSDYDSARSPKSNFDTFTTAKGYDVKELYAEFSKQKNESQSNKKQFVLVRDPQIAKAMKMNPNKLGQKYIYYRTTLNQGMETSSLLQGKKFTIKSVPLEASLKGLNGLINQINYEGDLLSLLRSKQLSKDNRKILVIYSKERRPQFLKQVKSIALKSAKMMKDDAIVIMTSNQGLLQKHFQIAADSFVTIRLIDTQKMQPPILTLPGMGCKDKRVYSRTTMSGPFSVQNLCRFVQNKKQWKQYYERKANLQTLESIVALNQNLPSETVVLHWKQGCKGCELTMNYLEHIKTILNNLSQQQVLKYEIQRPSVLKNVQFRKFNIINESNQINEKDHDVTPKLILHSQGKQKDLAIGEILAKIAGITLANEQEMHNKIMKQIIQTININLQALENS